MKRTFNFVVNWILFLTVPVWGGFFVYAILIHDAVTGRKNARGLLTGKTGIWK